VAIIDETDAAKTERPIALDLPGMEANDVF
jgi:hypothetical protein